MRDKGWQTCVVYKTFKILYLTSKLHWGYLNEFIASANAL